jgi:type VI secretion system protein ImpK
MAHAAGAGPGVRRGTDLALIFQELLTAVVRLKSNRQAVNDAASFRQHIREALKTAAHEARDVAAYSSEDVKMAMFAVVGFLDETILNARNPIFADWPRKPLQEELFGTHLAGEQFFQNLDTLLGRNDSPDTADTLEVHQLCLLLGFRGRYSARSAGELQSLLGMVAQKMQRIRGGSSPLSPWWQLPQPANRGAKDPWTKRLVIACAVCLALAVLLFAGFKLSLSSGVTDVANISGSGRS